MKSNPKILLIITLVMISIYTFGQKTQKSLSEERLGAFYFNQNAFSIAIRHYKNAYTIDTLTKEIPYKIAQSYYRMRDFEKAEIWTQKYVDLDPILTEDNIYYFIEILASNKRYNEAEYWYQRYIELDTINTERIERIQSYLIKPDYNRLIDNYLISPLNINTKDSEFAPSYYKNGIIFLSNRSNSMDRKKRSKHDGINYLNLHYTKRIRNNNCSKPKLFSKDIATLYHEGPVAFYDNNSKIIFTQTNTSKKIFKTKAIKARNGSISLNLYTADVVRDKITNIKPFKYNSDDFSSANPTVSKDGKKLIFSSDGPDSYGGSDLYLCQFVNNEWTAPKNMGKGINTSQSELFPFINGNILYFSSDGHKGLGGLDMYYTKLVNNTPTKIVNLGFQINSPSDDFGFITKNGNSGYFASNRGGKNDDNIYFTEKQTSDNLSAHIKVYDKKTHTVLRHADLEVIDSITSKSVIAYDNNGDTLLKFQISEEVIYKVIASHQDYFSRDTIFHSGNHIQGILEWNIGLDSIRPNIPIRLKNIYYDFDKSSLRNSSKIELNRLIIWLQINKDVRVQIRAHTDIRGSDNYNLHLSQRRAQSVVDYLTQSGIDSKRLIAKGLGESEPLVSCDIPTDCSSTDHQMNRRAEISVESTLMLQEKRNIKSNLDEVIQLNTEELE